MTAPAAVAEPLVITAAGVHDLTLADYLADPVAGGSLSSTGAKKLLPPSCPALYRHWRDDPDRETKPEWDLGHAAHKLVLGVGPELVTVFDEWGKDPTEWRTNNVKAAVQAVRDRGAVPLKPGVLEVVEAMAAALRAHPFAAKLFTPGAGEAEQTIVWRDAETGVWCRALLDWLAHPVPGKRFVFRDYKTSTLKGVLHPDRTVDEFGYYVQAAFHLAGLQSLGLAGDDAQALIVLQMKDPPHLVRVVQPDPNAMRIGGIQVREALRLHAECSAAERRGDPNPWPAWSGDTEWVSLPAWTERQFEEDL